DLHPPAGGPSEAPRRRQNRAQGRLSLEGVAAGMHDLAGQRHVTAEGGRDDVSAPEDRLQFRESARSGTRAREAKAPDRAPIFEGSLLPLDEDLARSTGRRSEERRVGKEWRTGRSQEVSR